MSQLPRRTGSIPPFAIFSQQVDGAVPPPRPKGRTLGWTVTRTPLDSILVAPGQQIGRELDKRVAAVAFPGRDQPASSASPDGFAAKPGPLGGLGQGQPWTLIGHVLDSPWPATWQTRAGRVVPRQGVELAPAGGSFPTVSWLLAPMLFT
jgi:hypothetical protein